VPVDLDEPLGHDADHRAYALGHVVRER
jgi:hypothetical protein